MSPSYELWDDEAWDRGLELFQAWKAKLYDKDLYYEITRFVTKHRHGGRPVEICAPQKGAFNVHYRVRYDDGGSAMIRFPIPGFFRFADEKLLTEVAVMRYVADHTTIPTPFVFHYGTTEESPGKLGPFIIMEYLENAELLVDVLNTPGFTSKMKPVLDPNIDEAKLEYIYGQMADVLAPAVYVRLLPDRLPGLRRDEDGDEEPVVMTRPLGFNIAQLGEVGGVPHSKLPVTSKTYSSSTEYYSALADMHLQQLSFQRNPGRQVC